MGGDGGNYEGDEVFTLKVWDAATIGENTRHVCNKQAFEHDRCIGVATLDLHKLAFAPPEEATPAPAADAELDAETLEALAALEELEQMEQMDSGPPFRLTQTLTLKAEATEDEGRGLTAELEIVLTRAEDGSKYGRKTQLALLASKSLGDLNSPWRTPPNHICRFCRPARMPSCPHATVPLLRCCGRVRIPPRSHAVSPPPCGWHLAA